MIFQWFYSLTLSLKSTPDRLKNMLDQSEGSLTYDLWNTSPMQPIELCGQVDLSMGYF